MYPHEVSLDQLIEDGFDIYEHVDLDEPFGLHPCRAAALIVADSDERR